MLLTKDNTNDAAAAGTAIVASFQNFDTTVFISLTKKCFCRYCRRCKRAWEHLA
jgi:hypothetical protein